MYALFAFEPLHNLLLDRSMPVKECTVNYSSSDRLVSRELVKERRLVLKIRPQVLPVFNFWLETIGIGRKVSAIQVHLSNVRPSDRGSGLFTRNGLLVILEWSIDRLLDRILLFVVTTIPQSTKHGWRAPREKIHSLYSDLVYDVTGPGRYLSWEEESLQKTDERAMSSRRIFVKLLMSTEIRSLTCSNTIYWTTWWKAYGGLRRRLSLKVVYMNTLMCISSILLGRLLEGGKQRFRRRRYQSTGRVYRKIAATIFWW